MSDEPICAGCGHPRPSHFDGLDCGEPAGCAAKCAEFVPPVPVSVWTDDATVDAVARAIYQATNHVKTWDTLTDTARKNYRRMARAALSVVAGDMAELRDRAEKWETRAHYAEAFRPEAVAEVAVQLTEESDWQAMAAWCGGTIHTSGDPSGEYTSRIHLPGGNVACEGMWITLGHDGVFRARVEIEQPSGQVAGDMATLAAIREIVRGVGPGMDATETDQPDSYICADAFDEIAALLAGGEQ